MLRSALLAYQKHQQTDSPDYAVTLANWGQILEAKQELGAAAPVYEQAIGIFENAGAPARTELASTLANLGELYGRLDRPAQARLTEEHALGLLRPSDDALLRVQILRNLGNIVAAGGKPADSVAYFERSLYIQEKTLG